jgi:hypothetical protein
MNVNARTRRHSMGENLISGISVGTIFILIGIVFVLAQPNSLWDSIVDFFSHFTLRSVPTLGFSLPAPANTAAHAVFYTAAFQFSIGLGILQIILLMLRLGMRSPIGKTAEVVGNLVFWFGAAYIITTYLGDFPNITQWFMFWAGILIMIGLSLIARALVLLTKRI